MKAWIEKHWPLVWKSRYCYSEAAHAAACKSANETYAKLQVALTELSNLKQLENELRRQVFRLSHITVTRSFEKPGHHVSVFISDYLCIRETPVEIAEWISKEIGNKLFVEMTKGATLESKD